MSALVDEPLRFAEIGTAEIAYRVVGSGPPLLFIHGWPLSGATFRHLVPELARRFTCYVPDTPGAGDTRWRDPHDFRFAGQAEAYVRLLDRLQLDRLSIVAHDTGATIARELALKVGPRVERMAIINTEIPAHRPPWIPFYQRIASPAAFRLLLRSRRFRRSAMGFGGCFADRDLIEGEFARLFVDPLLASPRRLDGQLRYLRGIDWDLVDSLAARHRDLAARVLLVWGEDDPTFPLDRARAMTTQLRDCAGLAVVPGARLLPHEEKPAAVLSHIVPFLTG